MDPGISSNVSFPDEGQRNTDVGGRICLDAKNWF